MLKLSFDQSGPILSYQKSNRKQNIEKCCTFPRKWRHLLLIFPRSEKAHLVRKPKISAKSIFGLKMGNGTKLWAFMNLNK